MVSLPLSLLGNLRLSAASALVCQDDSLWSIADDALTLHRYSLTAELLAEWPLLPGNLPAEAAARKQAKPDFEALLQLPDAGLLALGSGSTERRRRGCLFRAGTVRTVDLTPLYRQLERNLAELNVEGGVVAGGRLILAQRGNGALGANALILLDLQRALGDLEAGHLSAAGLLDIHPVELGTLEQVPLGLTDLAVDPQGRLYFSAAAEASASTYHDGACAGSALGRFDAALRVERCQPLAPREKIEAIAFLPDGRLLLVADPDDPQRLAPLYALEAAQLAD